MENFRCEYFTDFNSCLVTIEAEVIDATHLLVSLDFCHYYISILLISPFLAEKLVKVDRLKRTNLRCIFNELIKVTLLGHLTLLTLAGQSNTSLLASNDTLVTFLFIVLSSHGTYILEDLCTQSWHLLELFKASLHLSLELRVSGKHLFHLGWRDVSIVHLRLIVGSEFELMRIRIYRATRTNTLLPTNRPKGLSNSLVVRVMTLLGADQRTLNLL